MLGGSTSLNYMAYVRGHPNDFNKWSHPLSYPLFTLLFLRTMLAYPLSFLLDLCSMLLFLVSLSQLICAAGVPLPRAGATKMSCPTS
jgi:hypothetical protein